MSIWDTPAANWLNDRIEQLRSAGVVDVFHDNIGRVWRANLARYEPSELGDTPQSLGLVSWTDISQLVFRHYAGPVSEESPVRASLPYSSVVVEACGVRVQIMKAPPSSSRTPVWGNFAWKESDSKTRYRAARDNTTAYVPSASDQNGRPQLLSTDLSPATLWGTPSDPSELRDFMLVWSGQLETGLTAGWLGAPSLGPIPWFAIAPLWLDEGDQRAIAASKISSPDDGDSFARLPEPTVRIGMKATPAERAE